VGGLLCYSLGTDLSPKKAKTEISSYFPLLIGSRRLFFLIVESLAKRPFSEVYGGAGIPGNTFSVYMLLIDILF